MIKLFKYEGYKLNISEEALLSKPFKEIWQRDKSKSKDKALQELGYVYFISDPRSDYQYLVDEEERSRAIKEGEGIDSKWKPDKVVLDAITFYKSFKPTSALLLEDTRFAVDKLRKLLREIDLTEVDNKGSLKDGVIEDNSVIDYVLPIIPMGDKLVLFLQSNDIDYIIEEWDDVEVEKPKKQTLILPKKKEIIV